MKKNYILTILTVLFLNGLNVNAQSTEDFESEQSGTTLFKDNGQYFTITSNSEPDSYRIGSFADSGWNGTEVDQIFIESLGPDNDEDGTSFIIASEDKAAFSVKSLYFFISTPSIMSAPNATLTIEGKKGGEIVYSFTKTSGFSDVESFTPNNGYTFIDFSIEGGTDNSNTEIDQVVFTTTNDGDYVSLDTFTWMESTALSTNDPEIKTTIKILPNPSTEFIQFSGLSKAENYTIYNTLGIEINSGTISDNEKIEVKNYAKGVYFLKLEEGDTIKFLKE
jgi:hypothetical protein